MKLWSGDIGSDITFFFSSGTAYCTGRGDDHYNSHTHTHTHNNTHYNSHTHTHNNTHTHNSHYNKCYYHNSHHDNNHILVGHNNFLELYIRNFRLSREVDYKT